VTALEIELHRLTPCVLTATDDLQVLKDSVSRLKHSARCN